MIEFIDTHIHLQDFKSDFAPQVLANKQAKKLVLISAKEEDYLKIATLLKQYPQRLIGAFGVHPWYADEPFDKGMLEEKLKAFPKSLVGEIGVDGIKKKVDEKQHQLFRAQIEVAYDYSRPVIIHAARAFMALSEHEKELKKVRYVHHSYTKNFELLKFIQNTGGYVGLGAHFIKQEKAKELWQAMDKNKILFETDAPYQVDEAHYINVALENLQKLAEIAEMNIDDLVALLNHNAEEFLRF